MKRLEPDGMHTSNYRLSVVVENKGNTALAEALCSLWFVKK